MAKPTSRNSRNRANEAIAASRKAFIGLGVFSLFINLLMLTGPLYMLQVYDRVLASSSIPTLVALTLLVAVLYLTLGLLDWCRSSLFSVVASNIEGRLSEPAITTSFQQNLSQPGRTTDRSLRDLRTVRRFIGSPALPALFDAPFSPLFFVVLFMMHAFYGIWALVGAGVLVTLALINQAINRKALREAEMQEQQANQSAGELLRHSEVISALGMKDRLVRRWRKQFDDSDTALTQTGESLGGFSAATKAFRLLLQSGILGLGAWLSIEQLSTPGAMIAASILMGRAIAPIEQIVGQWRNVSQARQSWTSLTEAIAGLGDDTQPMELPPLRGRVDFENVTAAPPGVKTPVLRQIALSLNAGDCLGIIGPSASGKSTFARILLGIWQPMAGVVRLDGADVNTIPRERLGPQVGYMPQQVDLFAGSVRDNIARFDPGASAEAVVAAAQAAGCHELILSLPDGYETDIGENGAFLSAGQRQRVGLARALFGDPALVVLDEPNSNLDGEGDTALQKAISGLKQRGATVVIIAHRPNAIAHCNRLIVLDQGRIRLEGPRDEVLAKLQPASPQSRVAPIRK
jgi:PrtD family type I secretion system ABC transporter